jgi:hypothetical protein
MNKRLTFSPAFSASCLTEIVGAVLLILSYSRDFQWYQWLNYAALILHYPAILMIGKIRTLHSMNAQNVNFLIFLILLQWLIWILTFKLAFFLVAGCQGKIRRA